MATPYTTVTLTKTPNKTAGLGFDASGLVVAVEVCGRGDFIASVYSASSPVGRLFVHGRSQYKVADAVDDLFHPLVWEWEPGY
jgi:hypothetical protein